MKIEISSGNIWYNFHHAKRICDNLGVQFTLYCKSFYEEYLDFIDCTKWTNSKENTRCYKLYEYEYSKFDSSLHISGKTLEKVIGLTDHSVFIPLAHLEEREGVTIDEAINLINYCERNKIQVDGFVLNYGCVDSKLPTFNELNDYLDKIKYIFGDQMKISIGGSYFLSWTNMPEAVSELRIGEFILNGKIPYVNKQIGKIGVKAKYRILSQNKDQILIEAGYSNLAFDTIFEGLKIKSINTEYTILEKLDKRMLFGEYVDARLSYKNMSMVL